MGIVRVGRWRLARSLMSPGTAIRAHAAMNKAVQQEAQLARRKIVEAFNTSGSSNGKAWSPNKSSTVQSKGSSKPLVDRGDLRNSITVIEGSMDAWIGVPNNKVHRDGSQLVDIASVHEFGKVIAVTVTPKMLQFLAINAQKLGLGGGGGNLKVGQILMIDIRQRSFLQATLDAHFNTLMGAARYRARVATLMGGAWALLSPDPNRFIKGKK